MDGPVERACSKTRYDIRADPAATLHSAENNSLVGHNLRARPIVRCAYPTADEGLIGFHLSRQGHVVLGLELGAYQLLERAGEALRDPIPRLPSAVDPRINGFGVGGLTRESVLRSMWWKGSSTPGIASTPSSS